VRINDQLARELHIVSMCFDDADTARRREWAEHFARELAREAGAGGRPTRERDVLTDAAAVARRVLDGSVSAGEFLDSLDRVLSRVD
jgi:hypothetical protein